MSQVRIVGIDETSLRRGHNYVTVVHDLDAKRLLYCTPGLEHTTIKAFAQDLRDHGGQPLHIGDLLTAGSSLQYGLWKRSPDT
jgi:transposase